MVTFKIAFACILVPKLRCPIVMKVSDFPTRLQHIDKKLTVV